MPLLGIRFYMCSRRRDRAMGGGLDLRRCGGSMGHIQQFSVELSVWRAVAPCRRTRIPSSSSWALPGHPEVHGMLPAFCSAVDVR